MFVRLLGPVALGEEEHTVQPLGAQAPAAALAALAVAQGRTVSVDQLLDDLWDEPPPSARNSLQVAIARLRRLGGAELIHTEPGGYRLATDIVRVDLLEVEQWIGLARQSLAQGDPSAAHRAAVAARELYVGEPVQSLRSRFADLLRHRAQLLNEQAGLLEAQALLALGRAEEAASVAEALTAASPLDEAAQLVHLKALRDAGRGSEGLRVYGRLRELLADELGADPSPALRDLFAQLLDPPAATPAPAPRGPRGFASMPAARHPVVGRDEELRRLADLMSSGHRLITLIGPGGIGKTTLAVEGARARACASGHASVFIDLVAAHDVVSAWAALGAACRVAPDEVITALHGQPLVVVLDNAEHLLPDLAEVVVELLGIDGVVLLVTSRSPLQLSAEKMVPVSGLPCASASSPAVSMLADRSGLDDEDPNKTDTDGLVALAAWADGVPLVLELMGVALTKLTPGELMSRLRQSEIQLSDDAKDRPQRHRTVAAAVDWSIQQCAPATRAVLGAMCLVAGSFDLPTVRDLTRSLTDDGRAAVGELTHLSLAQRVCQPGGPRWRLLEPVRVAVHDSDLVPPPTTAVWRDLADHVERRLLAADEDEANPQQALVELLRIDEPLVRLALEWGWEHDHDALGRMLPSHLTGLYYLDRLGEAIALGVRALDLKSTSTSADRARLAVALNQTLAYTGTGSELQDRLSAMVTPVLDQLSVERRLRWIASRADQLHRDGRIDEALELLGSAQPRQPRQRVRLGLTRQIILGAAGRHAEARDELQRLIPLVDPTADPAVLLVALNSLGYSTMVLGDDVAADQALRRAATLAADLDLHVQGALVSVNRGWTACRSGRPREALAHLVDVLDRADLVAADEDMALEILLVAGLSFVELGDHVLAAEMATAATGATCGTVPIWLDSFGRASLERLRDATSQQKGIVGDLHATLDLLRSQLARRTDLTR